MAAAEEKRTQPGEEEQQQPPLGSTAAHPGHTEPPPPTEDPQQPPPTEDQGHTEPPPPTEDPQQPPPTEDQGHTEPPPPTEDPGHTEQPPPTEDPGHTEQPPPTEDTEPSEGPEERAAEVGATRPLQSDTSVEPSLHHFKMRKFFVLRPGTLEQAIKDVTALVEEVDGSLHSVWLMAEVDHWNNEKERLVLITDNSLLVFKYNFVMFNCDHILRIPLNIIDRISHGPFSFPKHSLLQREGEGLRLFWDRQREPSFTSRWNPFAIDFPFITFINHPVRSVSGTFAAMCHIENFQERIKEAAQKAHAMKPFPGKANGVLVLKQPIHTDAYVGLMSFLGNQNKLGYSMARGNLGF